MIKAVREITGLYMGLKSQDLVDSAPRTSRKALPELTPNCNPEAGGRQLRPNSSNRFVALGLEVLQEPQPLVLMEFASERTSKRPCNLAGNLTHPTAEDAWFGDVRACISPPSPSLVASKPGSCGAVVVKTYSMSARRISPWKLVTYMPNAEADSAKEFLL